MASRYTSAAYAYDYTAQEQASYGYGAERRRRAAETRAPRFDVYTGAGRQADQDVSPAFLHVVKVFAVLAVLFCAIGLGRVTIASATTALLNDNAQISQEIEEVREAGENLEVMNVLEREMRYPEEMFGVVIPSSELAYLAELLLPYRN